MSKKEFLINEELDQTDNDYGPIKYDYDPTTDPGDGPTPEPEPEEPDIDPKEGVYYDPPVDIMTPDPDDTQLEPDWTITDLAGPPYTMWVLVNEEDHVRICSSHLVDSPYAKACHKIIVEDEETFQQLMKNCGYYRCREENKLEYEYDLHLYSDREEIKAYFHGAVLNDPIVKRFTCEVQNIKYEIVYDEKARDALHRDHTLVENGLYMPHSKSFINRSQQVIDSTTLRLIFLGALLYEQRLENTLNEWWEYVDSINTIEELAMIDVDSIIKRDMYKFNYISLNEVQARTK